MCEALKQPMLTPEKTHSSNGKTIEPEYLEMYAECDAIAGQPNPRYKQSSIYCNRYLSIRVNLVGADNLTDTELDLTIF